MIIGINGHLPAPDKFQLMKDIGIELVACEVIERFFSNTVLRKVNGLWHLLWIGPLNNSGYGSFRYNGRVYGSHVMAFMIQYGRKPYPCCLHKNICHIRHCVAYEHLYEGDHRQNTLDSITMGTHASKYNFSVREKIRLSQLGRNNSFYGKTHTLKNRIIMRRSAIKANLVRWGGVVCQ